MRGYGNAQKEKRLIKAMRHFERDYRDELESGAFIPKQVAGYYIQRKLKKYEHQMDRSK